MKKVTKVFTDNPTERIAGIWDSERFALTCHKREGIKRIHVVILPHEKAFELADFIRFMGGKGE